MMDVIQILEWRMHEREQLVEHITAILQADPRVAAAALTSSYAGGEIDGLSDLDILVIVSDEAVADFVPPRQREVNRFGEVVWCQEVPGNSPPGGSYLGVGFRGSGYPQCTDWYWQPLSLAAFPSPSVAMVEKGPIKRVSHESMVEIVNAGRLTFPPPPPSPEFRPSDPVAGHWSFRLAYFWRMSGAAAAQLARGHVVEAETIIGKLTDILADLTGAEIPLEGSGFEQLRALCAYAETLVDRASELGAIVPADRTWVIKTIDFMEALTRVGWQSPK